jgi:hypothetical protein
VPVADGLAEVHAMLPQGLAQLPRRARRGAASPGRRQAKFVMWLYHVDDLMAGVAARRRVGNLNASGAVATKRLRRA